MLLIIAIFIPTQIVFATPSSDTVNFRLQADTGWVDSGFELQSGQQEEGPPVAEFLATLLKRRMPGSVKVSYIQQILAAFPKAQSIGTVPSRPIDQDISLIEPLTAREVEVLQLIVAGESNKDIADKLVITLSAVKKHTGNIFRKLNVSHRTQAVERARTLGLLATDE
jgi:LuxR family maltose regulon positive regulatory protein